MEKSLALSLRNLLVWFSVIKFCTNFKGMTFQYIYLYTFLINYDWKIYSISNKSTKTKQALLYTIAKKKRHKIHTFKGRVNGKERNVMAAI